MGDTSVIGNGDCSGGVGGGDDRIIGDRGGGFDGDDVVAEDTWRSPRVLLEAVAGGHYYFCQLECRRGALLFRLLLFLTCYLCLRVGGILMGCRRFDLSVDGAFG